MENILKQKYKLPKSAARSIVAEAKSLLKIPQGVMYSKPLEVKCVSIAENRGFLENGKPIEKKPQRTTWVPSQQMVTPRDLKGRVTQLLAQPEPISPNRRRQEFPRISDRISNTSRLETSPRHSNSRDKSRYSSHDRSVIKPSKSSSSERPRRSRFVPSVRVSKVLDPIVEASNSTDDDSVGSSSERPTRRRLRRNPSSETNVNSKAGAASGTSTMTLLMPLRDHIMRIVGECSELDVISDHAKGFRFTDFDSRSYTSLTVSTDAESVSSNGSGKQWGSGSPRKVTDSPRKSVSMGSATVKSLAMRFSDGSPRVAAPPPRPVRRCNSNDSLEEYDERTRELPMIRVLNEPPIGVIVTAARIPSRICHADEY
mmetsp:Transcript_4555/g.9191  ORF Transcript_4555/g.9191 Transcript_4555/m.9191 type:complete len:371 (+) Transcript_4555:138-1250(+)|eukprot:scaffold34645_cov201-Amphora_coffeaeformis.AAC.1